MQTIYSASETMQECIAKCLNCHQISLWTIDHCLQQGGGHCRAEHIKLLQDCAEIASVTADLLSRDSWFQRKACALCAEVANACADECAEIGGDDRVKACAESARLCAFACLRVAAGNPPAREPGER